MGKSLRTFLDDLAKSGLDDVKIVNKEVDPEYELTSVIAKLEKQGRSDAVLFKNVKGSKLPVLINVGASYERLSLAIGTTKENMVETYSEAERKGAPVKEVSTGPVKDVILTGSDVDLGKLPTTIHNEMDAGRYISAAITVVKDPATGAHNGGMYRLQVQGKDQLGLFVNPANHAYLITQDYKELGKNMEVAVVLGHHPCFLMAGISKLEGFGGEYEVAGGLLGESLEVVKGETIDMMVPAEAEIVIEGVVDTTKTRDEGPFGEWPRYYTGRGERPFIKVTAITMRKDAIYENVMAAHNEHNMLGALPRMGSLLRRVKEVLPSIKAVNLPLSGGGRVFCYISMNKRSDGEPKQAAFAALSTEPNIKHAILVDDDIDVFNEQEVLWAVATRFEADTDLIIMPNCIGSHLIPTAYDITKLKHGAMQTKLIFDATMPAKPTPFPKRADVPRSIEEKINLAEYLGM
jgi:2,5-furandicarboxylate decarboxylase 1